MYERAIRCQLLISLMLSLNFHYVSKYRYHESDIIMRTALTLGVGKEPNQKVMKLFTRNNVFVSRYHTIMQIVLR